ncbi:Cyclin-C1-1 -like protein [Gossypium arboreum]|uniref:Cyclin-C1-1-like protein n=1 Tax=Gossypium arboreum TaxID=29729 RepID=A0A0B0MQA0_GOSAR|nr:Cyclin-C1-1 -like protein [Gossypium arboreum]
MAANFWTSSHFKQLLDPEEVDVVHQQDKDKGITLEEFKLIKMHMANYIMKLAQNVKVRQRRSMSEYDPRLVAPTCLYLASKAEESTVQARLLDGGMNDMSMTQLSW